MIGVGAAPSAVLGGAGGLPSVTGGDAKSEANARSNSSLDFKNDFIIGGSSDLMLPILGIGALILVVLLVIK